MHVLHFDEGHVGSPRNQVVAQGAVKQLTTFIVYQLLIERVADTEFNAAVYLPVQDQGIQDRAAVVDDDITLDLYQHRLRIHFHNHCHCAEASCSVGRAEVSRRFEAGLSSRFDCAAHRVGLHGQFCQRDGLLRDIRYADLTLNNFKLFFGGFQNLACQRQDLLAYIERSSIDG